MKTLTIRPLTRFAARPHLAAIAVATLLAGTAFAQRPHGRHWNQPQNPAIGYASPRMSYYSGPTYGPVSPFNYGYGPGYGRGQGGNVTYYQRGRNAFYIQTHDGPNGQYNVNTGFMRVAP